MEIKQIRYGDLSTLLVPTKEEQEAYQKFMESIEWFNNGARKAGNRRE